MMMELFFWQKPVGRPQCFFFVDSIFINDSEEFRKMFVARIALAHVFKKTNTNVTEQLTSKFEIFTKNGHCSSCSVGQ